MEKETNKFEIAPGMSVEEMKAVYFNADALREPPYKVYRLDAEGYRYYYRFVDGEPEFYPSVTTMLRQVMPTPYGLIDWMLAQGKEQATEKRDLAAAYGTFMHVQFERLIIDGSYNFETVPAELLGYMKRENLPEKVFAEWCVKVKKDVCAFAQFVRDYKVRPLAVEISLAHPDYHFAGCIDMPCIMTDPKKGNDFTAIVDFKSGRNGFYEDYELQLHLYRMMWEANFPEMPIERVYNFAPKDWRTKPTYTLKDQTEAASAAKIPHLLALAMIEDGKRNTTVTVVRGVLDLRQGEVTDNILSLSLAELIKAKPEADAVPDIGADILENVPEISENVPKVAENVPEMPENGKTTPKVGKGKGGKKKPLNTGEFFDELNGIVEDGLFGKEAEKNGEN